jgi:hypothetical protein
VVEPHFTFVFPVSDFNKEEFIEEVKKQTGNSKIIPFSIGQTIVHKDELSLYYYHFLVPEKGKQVMIELHDKLYSGKFQSALIKEIKYTPHITIGTNLKIETCNAMLIDWNKNNHSIHGTISSLSVVEYANDKVTELTRIMLKA